MQSNNNNAKEIKICKVVHKAYDKKSMSDSDD